MTDEEIEAVARRLCAELNVDPDERVMGGWRTDWTPAEIAADRSDFTPDVAIIMPRWRTYRGKAAELIAASRALEALSGAMRDSLASVPELNDEP